MKKWLNLLWKLWYENLVSVRVLQRNRFKRIFICLSVTGVGSLNLETKNSCESWNFYLVKAVEPRKPVEWADGVSVQRPENQGARSVNAGVTLKVWEPRQEKMDVSAQVERANLLSFNSWFHSHPHWIGLCPPALKTVFFTLSMDSNTNLFQRVPHKLINNVLPAILDISKAS